MSAAAVPRSCFVLADKGWARLLGRRVRALLVPIGLSALQSAVRTILAPRRPGRPAVRLAARAAAKARGSATASFSAGRIRWPVKTGFDRIGQVVITRMAVSGGERSRIGEG